MHERAEAFDRPGCQRDAGSAEVDGDTGDDHADDGGDPAEPQGGPTDRTRLQSLAGQGDEDERSEIARPLAQRLAVGGKVRTERDDLTARQRFNLDGHGRRG